MSKHVGKEFISEKTYPSNTASVIIGRPINGITINGLEYLLDENNHPMEFPTESEAKAFLNSHGFFGESLEGFFFETDETHSDINRGEKAIIESFDEETGLYKVVNLSIPPHWFTVSGETLESLMAHEG